MRSEGRICALGQYQEERSKDSAAGLVSNELSDNHRVRVRTLPDSHGCISRSTLQQPAGHRSAGIASHRRGQLAPIYSADCMEGLSLGLVHDRPLSAGCVQQIAITCGFTFPVQSRTRFRTATDQKVGSSNLFGCAGERGCGLSARLCGSQWVSDRRQLPLASSLSAAARHNALLNKLLWGLRAPACGGRSWLSLSSYSLARPGRSRLLRAAWRPCSRGPARRQCC